MTEADKITRMYDPLGKLLYPLPENDTDSQIDPYALHRLDTLIVRLREGRYSSNTFSLKLWIIQPDRPIRPTKEVIINNTTRHPSTEERFDIDHMTNAQIVNFTEALAERPGLTIIYVK